MATYATGAAEPYHDPRDFQVEHFLVSSAVPVPDELDLRPWMQPVRNQGPEGTCTAFTGCALMGHFEQSGQKLGHVLAPRYLYKAARELIPVVGEGAQLRAIMAVLLAQGCPYEADQVYIPHQETPLGADGPLHAVQNRIGSYAAVEYRSPDAIQKAMNAFGAVAVSLAVCDGFFNPVKGEGGEFTCQLQGKPGDGHAVLLVGYSKKRQAWLLRNSWGTEWGTDGYAWLPWSYPLREAWSATPALLANGGWPPAPLVSWVASRLALLGIRI